MAMFHVKHTACDAGSGEVLVTASALAANTAGADTGAMSEIQRPRFPPSERISAVREFSLIRNLRHGRFPAPAVQRGLAGAPPYGR